MQLRLIDSTGGPLKLYVHPLIHRTAKIQKKRGMSTLPFFSTFIIKGKLAHTFSGNTSIQNYQLVLFVGETIVYREKIFKQLILKASYI